MSSSLRKWSSRKSVTKQSLMKTDEMVSYVICCLLTSCQCGRLLTSNSWSSKGTSKLWLVTSSYWNVLLLMDACQDYWLSNLVKLGIRMELKKYLCHFRTIFYVRVSLSGQNDKWDLKMLLKNRCALPFAFYTGGWTTVNSFTCSCWIKFALCFTPLKRTRI